MIGRHHQPRKAVKKLKDAYVRLFNVNPWEDT
jgi:hypothetical protein